MSAKPELLLVGGGGHCRSCIDVIEAEGRFRIAGIVERVGESMEPVLEHPVLGSDEDLPKLRERYPNALVTVGQIKTAAPRSRLFTRLKELDFMMPVHVSPKAYVSKHANLEEGTIVMHGAILNAGTLVGPNCIANSKALIEHDAVVESHCHISTGALVNGGVVIGSGSFIGSGAVIREGVRLGPNCVIAAGSIVLKDLPARTLVRSST